MNFENSWDVNWPMFNWSGFSDKSGIEGYYVYFGDNFNATPVKDGVYTKSNKSGPGFTLENPGIYYLIVQARDNQGNVSNPVYWTYYYKTPDNIGTLDYGESDTAKILSNRPTKIYIYSFDDGYKGDLLEVVYFNSSKIQRYILPTNNIYIEWESTKKKGFIAEELAVFQEDASYKEGHWHYYCDKQYYSVDLKKYIDCMETENEKELYSRGNNYMAISGLTKNQKYDFDMSGYYYKNNDLIYAYHHNILELTPSSEKLFRKSNFASKLKGNILLQVEANGEAFYINPDDENKYFLGRPDDAFQVMRKLGLGATHAFISGHTFYPNHVVGKILIDVEQNGEAYYIYPKDKKAYFLGRPADAFEIMRELGLGITNSDLSKIPEGNL